MNRKLSMLALFILFILACGEPPTPTVPTVDVQAAIAMTQTAAFEKAWLPYTQTAAAMPTLTPTQTLTPIPTNTTEPTFTPAIVATSVTFPTATLVVFVPTSTSAQGICSCTGDTLNCTDFGGSRARAQACYDYCVAAGRGDIHSLDSDGDGEACESL